MKEGTKVKVVANVGGHEFKIGEIVARCWVSMSVLKVWGFIQNKLVCGI